MKELVWREGGEGLGDLKFFARGGLIKVGALGLDSRDSVSLRFGLCFLSLSGLCV